MNTMIYPGNLDMGFYDVTIRKNPNIVLDGFYYGPFNKKYKQSRVGLLSNLKLIYTCDYWLDGHYFHDNQSYFHVPDTTILRLIEKYYATSIPMGCFAIAVKHREEEHSMAPDGNGFDLIFNKKAYFDYLELYNQ